jgi:hypothetical protein
MELSLLNRIDKLEHFSFQSVFSQVLHLQVRL